MQKSIRITFLYSVVGLTCTFGSEIELPVKTILGACENTAF